MHIDSYSFGRIEVDGSVYSNDVKIFPGKIKDNWWRIQGHSLCMNDITDIMEYKPEIFIIGTGANSVMQVPPDIIKKIEDSGIKVIAENTGYAVKLFNDYIKKKKNVVGGFHLTC